MRGEKYTWGDISLYIYTVSVVPTAIFVRKGHSSIYSIYIIYIYRGERKGEWGVEGSRGEEEEGRDFKKGKRKNTSVLASRTVAS